MTYSAMLISRTLATAAVLASTATAFFPWFPKYRCVEEHTCVAERTVEDSGLGSAIEATLKLVQRIPKVTTFCSPRFRVD